MLNPRTPSKRIPATEIPKILDRLSRGEFQNRIAADYDVNQGRISEIKTKYLGSGKP